MSHNGSTARPFSAFCCLVYSRRQLFYSESGRLFQCFQQKAKALASRPMLDVLFEDNHLLAVAKPPNLPTMGVRSGSPSLLSEAKQYIKQKYNKPGNVYLGVVSRLDSVVTGVVVFARTSKAARRLSEQFRSASVEKVYWALVSGKPQPREGRLVDWLRKEERRHKMIVASANASGAVEARLSYRTLTRFETYSHLEIRLETGRKHQIRVQFAHLGHPILGDRKYGSRSAFSEGIALHARRLVIQHPTRQTPVEIAAPLPTAWGAFEVSDD